MAKVRSEPEFPIVVEKLDIINKDILYLREIEHYLFINSEGLPSLTYGKCKHQGALLSDRIINGCVTCPRHKWILNIKESVYSNPHNLSQIPSQYEAKVVGSQIHISPIKSINPIRNGEYQYSNKIFNPNDRLCVEYVNHACAIFATPKLSFISDPWILGGSFSTGWFLKKKTLKSDIVKILKIDYCFISHSHPDHLNPTSLLYLKNLGWNPTFIVPKFSCNDCTIPMLLSLGFTKLIELENMQTHQFSEDPRLELEMRFDNSGRNDSGFKLKYGATTLVNLVDAPNLNLKDIQSVDVLLAPFANGASGYPVCWQEMLGLKKINEMKILGNKSALNSLKELCLRYKPSVVLPFAGYFHSPLPEDELISSLNKKNTPADVQSYLKDIVEVIDPETLTEDKTFGNMNIKAQKKTNDLVKSSDSVGIAYERFRDLLRNRYDDFCINELIDYLTLQNFTDDLVVNFEACSVDFSQTKFSLCWDFSSNKAADQSFEYYIKREDIRSLHLKVRRYSLGYTIRNNLPWEEFSIGFQAKFNRFPNTYNFAFWNYFQNHLVQSSPPYSDYKEYFDELSSQFLLDHYLS